MCTRSARAWAKLPHVAASLLAEAVSARDVAAVISRELGALTRQAAVIAERRMQEAGLGEPPCPYALAVLGSAGRGESLLAMDQDNALVFAQGEPDGPEDRWFELLGTHVADILHEVGVPYCRGGVMAKNSQWRGSVATWRERVTDWIATFAAGKICWRSTFFSICAASMASAALGRLRCGGRRFDAAKGNAGFAKLLAEAAGRSSAGSDCSAGLRDRAGADRSEERRPVRDRQRRAGAGHPPSRARTLDAGAACRVKALGLGGDSDLDAIVDAQAVVPRPRPRSADRRHP